MSSGEKRELFKDLSFVNEINSMAVIGTSKKRDFFFLRNHQENFKGKLYVVHPSLKQIPNFDDGTEGRIYKSVKDIPDDVDFVFISVPPDAILKTIDKCVEKGVKLASIFTAEFSDAGTQEGRNREKNLLEHAQNKLRILGPNGMGLYYPKKGIAWRPMFPNQAGNIGFIAQSGGICNIAIYSTQELNIKFSKVFSYGNGADLDFADILHFLSNDPETDIILGYLEGISKKRGIALQNVLQNNSKPIIIIKGGKSPGGSRAAETHTATLSGENNIWKGFFHQCNVIEVDTMEQLLYSARIIDCYETFDIKNVALLSISGGYGVILVDLLAQEGINVPPFDKKIQEKLDDRFFTLGTSSSNPLDVSAQIYNSEVIYEIIDIALTDEKIDGLIMDLPTWYFNQNYHLKKDPTFEPNMIKALCLGHKHKKPL
ncbi:MAG: hypothetical protein GF317_05045, partial [Candidatus Lokiarchaeota archaeon]|nr:hypothetical protein [Candidatus Lokiarchaeota archaeon]MBD3199172.1 hypothetical protein [Candidatus Lokiarchaeota archaeon]